MCGKRGEGGETIWFWEDLSTNSNLIGGVFNTATNIAGAVTIVGNTNFTPYVPAAKIGGGNYVFVNAAAGYNYFQIVSPTQVLSDTSTIANPGMTVSQAYGIDQKVDDGLPTSGNVQANMIVSNTTSGQEMSCSDGPTGCLCDNCVPSAGVDTAATCYNTTGPAYSMSINQGSGVNCALTFRFQ